MKTVILTLFASAALAGCVVIPAEPAFVGRPARAYVSPPAVVVVPGRGYFGYGHSHGYSSPPYRGYYY